MQPELPRLRVLLSFHYYAKVDLARMIEKQFLGVAPEIFADSGAFSAFTQKTKIDIGAYADWIKRWQHLFTTYANLDAIGDADTTWRNQQLLEQRGLQPLPVYHAGESFDILDRYLDAGHSYIALGGIAVRPVASYMPWLVQCFKRGLGRAVFHGFGVTGWEPLKALPWYSVDSSAWGKGFRYGKVPVFDDRRGAFFDVPLGNRKVAYRLAALIRSYGMDPETFADRAKNDRKQICGLSALSYMRAEAWLRRRHGLVQLPNGHAAGVKVHLVDRDRQHLGWASQGVKLHLANDPPNRDWSPLAKAAAGTLRGGVRIYLVDADPTSKDTAAASRTIGAS